METPPVAETQLVPLKYCSVLAALVSVPRVAVPLARAGVKVTAVVLAFDRLAVKVA